MPDIFFMTSLHPLPQAPPELKAIQDWLSTAITSGKFTSKDAKRRLKETLNRSSSDRLGTYIDDYWPRCFESLTDDFPRTARYLGDNWEAICRNYLQAYTSSRFTLYYLGREFPKFTIETNRSQWEIDLAAIEWAHLKAEISAIHPRFGLDATTQLWLQPHCTIIQLSHPYKQLVSESPCPPTGESVMIFQHDRQANWQVLDPHASSVFELFLNGTSLSDAFDQLIESGLTDDEMTYISTKIQSWMSLATQYQWLSPIPYQGVL